MHLSLDNSKCTARDNEGIMSEKVRLSVDKRGYFKLEEAKKLYQKHLSGEINISKEIWKWLIWNCGSENILINNRRYILCQL